MLVVTNGPCNNKKEAKNIHGDNVDVCYIIILQQPLKYQFLIMELVLFSDCFPSSKHFLNGRSKIGLKNKRKTSGLKNKWKLFTKTVHCFASYILALRDLLITPLCKS